MYKLLINSQKEALFKTETYSLHLLNYRILLPLTWRKGVLFPSMDWAISTPVSPVKQWTNRKNAPPTKYGYPVFVLRPHPLSWTMCGKPILSACNLNTDASLQSHKTVPTRRQPMLSPTSKASLKILHYQTNKQLTIGWKLLKKFLVENCGELWGNTYFYGRLL